MSILVTNLEDGAILPYSLALLSGEVTPVLSQASIIVQHQAAVKQPIAWPICDGRFKALVQLRLGENLIQLKFYDEVLHFTLNYEVPKFCRFVRPIYIIAADHDGYFQGPDDEERSPDSAIRRISLGAQLLQVFTAEKLHEHGLGRRTFVLETDLYPGRPSCHVFKSKLTYSQAHAMAGTELWICFAKELMSSKLFTEKDLCKWFAFISFTHYCPLDGAIPKTHSDVLKATKGHTALGGGGLALFGTGNLHTWAERLEDVSHRFADARKIDRSKFMDDSAYRQTHWANYSTGLGASLHELGHTFDLAHTTTGVMARGFDDLYRVFTVQPPVTSRAGSRRGSHLASPLPHSPRYSPAHQSKTCASGESSGYSTPKPSALSRPQPHTQIYQAKMSLRSMSPALHRRSASGTSSPVRRPSSVGGAYGECLPTVIQIETAFKRLKPVSVQTVTMKNYDASETRRTVVRHRDGTETITEVTKHCTGETIAKEVIKNPTTGKMKRTMSMSTSSDALNALAANTTSSSTPASIKHFTRLPLVSINSPKQQQQHQMLLAKSSESLFNKSKMTVSETTPRKTTFGASDRSSLKSLHLTNATNAVNGTSTTSSSSSSDSSTASTKENEKQDMLRTSEGSATSDPSHLPKSPDAGAPLLTFQEVQYKDGGAHWYRASAVLLRYHRWFNYATLDHPKPPELNGNLLVSTHGLRLIELRSLPDSIVFHHWEFLQMAPPHQFRLRYSEVRDLAPADVISITLVAEDDCGNIFKKKMSISVLKGESDSQGTAEGATLKDSAASSSSKEEAGVIAHPRTDHTQMSS